ncbi:MAG: UDP-N-acetylmuramate dehydrogenase [bacterium]|nr:UDP-N-acetylmuramate dehydrogenase [bacterium]
MDIHQNIPLKNYTTMKLGGNARFMTDARTPDDVQKICQNAKTQNLPIFILGGGSNIIAHDEGYAGIVVRNRISGFEVLEDTPSSVTIRVGAGENWDETVKKTVDMNLTGVEAMSNIPGTAGAAPVQNIGAYGQEIADTLIYVEVYDTVSDTFVRLENKDCGFSYRHSIFRGDQAGRYVITAICFTLFKSAPTPPFYRAIEEYFETNNITVFTPQVIRDTVIKIRTNKLPDPTKLPNAGSFFKNAIIEPWQLTDLLKKYPDMPNYDLPDGNKKIPTGWLIEQTGLKGETIHGMKVHDGNALVLINVGATSYTDLAAARDEVIGAVRDTFRIHIEQEPLELV